MFTFAELASSPEVQSVIEARLVANLAAAGLPTTSWAPSAVGGVELLRADLAAGTIAQYVAQRVWQLVTGRNVQLAIEGVLPDGTPAPYWLTYLAKKFYKLDKPQPSSTIENVALYLAPGASPVTQDFQPGDIIVKAPSTGNVYRSTGPANFGTTNTWRNFPLILDPTVDNPLMVPCQAAATGSSYADPEGAITLMVSAPAGIRCYNIRAADFTPMRTAGFSSGAMVGTRINPAIAPSVSIFRVRIDASGNVGAARFSLSIDGGATYRPMGTLPITVLSSGASLAFANGSSSPSFIQGDVLTIIAQDPILQRGADPIATPTFAALVSKRWPALSLIPTKATIELWATLASTEVAKVFSDADPNNPGGTIVTIASSSGPASPTAVVNVEDFINARLLGYKGMAAPTAPTVPGCTSPAEAAIVNSAIEYDVLATALILIPKEILATGQIQAQKNWEAYLDSLPLGGDPKALIELAEFEDILADVGAKDVQIPFINGVDGDVQVPAGSVAVASARDLISSCTWVPT